MTESLENVITAAQRRTTEMSLSRLPSRICGSETFRTQSLSFLQVFDTPDQPPPDAQACPQHSQTSPMERQPCLQHMPPTSQTTPLRSARPSGDVPHANHRRVQFKYQCENTRPGTHVRVVGSCPALGSWRPELGVVLQTNAENFPMWCSGVQDWEIDPDDEAECIEYKYVLCTADGYAEWWEEGDNRRLLPSTFKPFSTVIVCAGCNLITSQCLYYHFSSLQPRKTETIGGCPMRVSTQNLHKHGCEADEFQQRYRLQNSTPEAEGSFSTVWVCSERGCSNNNALRAAKIVRKSQLRPRDFKLLLGDDGEIQ